MDKFSSKLLNRLKNGLKSIRQNSFGQYEETSTIADIVKQTEYSHKHGSIWESIRKADKTAFERRLKENPQAADERGPVGECPVHLLFLYGSETHLNMARHLIERYPHTIVQIYEHPEYYGEVPLHIAIIKRNATMVEWLLSDEHNQRYRHQQLTSKASGAFFQSPNPCYFGETPLAFACCTNQWDMVEILLKYGASMDEVDSNGNTILHLLVIHNLPKMYKKFRERWYDEEEKYRKDHLDQSESETDSEYGEDRRTPIDERLNRDGLTPLTLAAKLGQEEMFEFLLDERKKIQWSYGPVSCVLYPLDQMDSDFHDEELEKPEDALKIIVQNGHVKLVMDPRMLDLVNRKWEKFARRFFFWRFLTTFIYLFIFLLTTIFDQSRTEIIEGTGDESRIVDVHPPGFLIQSICALGRLIVVAGAIWKGRGEVNEMRNLGFSGYFRTTGAGLLENCLACSFCLSIYLATIFRLLDYEAESAVLAIASILGWCYTLFFVLAFRLTGPFVVMIYKMLHNDVLRFCIIYVVFLIGFAQSFFILFSYNGFPGFLLSVKQCFLGMLGDFDLDSYAETSFRSVSVSLLIVYIIVVTILLLNLLVAMMGSTYGDIIDDATQIWNLERARIVFAIENEMSTEERKRPENRYWATLGGKRYLQVQEIDKKYLSAETENDEKINRSRKDSSSSSQL